MRNKAFISVSSCVTCLVHVGTATVIEQTQIKPWSPFKYFNYLPTKKKKSPEIEVDFSSSCKVCSLNYVFRLWSWKNKIKIRIP